MKEPQLSSSVIDWQTDLEAHRGPGKSRSLSNSKLSVLTAQNDVASVWLSAVGAAMQLFEDCLT